MSNAVKSVILSPEALGLAGLAPSKNTVRGAEDSYAKVPLVFRATRIRCNSLLKIPFHLYRDDEKTEAEWTFEYPLRKLLWRTRAAGLLTGAGYVLKRRNRVVTKEVQWLNPTTVQVNWDMTRKVRVFDQFINGEHFGPWTDADMVYIPEFSLRDDVGPGDCPAGVALNNAQLSHYITRMAGMFFETGAMPVTLITSAEGFGQDTERVENFFRRAIAGIQNAFRVIAVRGRDVKIERLQFPLKELATPELYEQARKGVSLAFEIPVTLLDDDANYATAKEHKRSFYDETVIPDADVFAEEFNAQLFHPLGLHLEFKPEEMDLYQEDERESAQAAQTFNSMLNETADFETFQFVASIYGIEYDAEMAKQVFAAKEKRRSQLGVGSRGTELDGGAEKAVKAENVDGVMIALPLPSGAASALASAVSDALDADAEKIPPEQMHLTLAYFGSVSDVNVSRETLQTLVRVFASEHPTLNGVIGGKGQFNHADENGRSAVYATFDSPALPAFQNDLVEMLNAAGIAFDRTHGFTPHITLGYVADGAALGEMELPDLQITFDSVVLAWGGEWVTVPLTTNMKNRSSPRGELLLGELAKWERAALKRIKSGGDLDFTSDVIPPVLHSRVLAQLRAASNSDEVKVLFEQARAEARDSDTSVPFRQRTVQEHRRRFEAVLRAAA